MAQLLFAMVQAGATRDWAAAQAAFPGARWEQRSSDTRQTATINGEVLPTAQSATGSTDVLPGTITLDRIRYEIVINGSRERVHAISINSPEGVVDDRAAVRRALEARGARWQSLGCIGFAMEIVRVGAGDASGLIDFSVNQASRVEPSIYYTLELETPPETGDLGRCEE